jgi:hypothetical protein
LILTRLRGISLTSPVHTAADRARLEAGEQPADEEPPDSPGFELLG